jgi:hypothetical protein
MCLIYYSSPCKWDRDRLLMLFYYLNTFLGLQFPFVNTVAWIKGKIQTIMNAWSQVKLLDVSWFQLERQLGRHIWSHSWWPPCRYDGKITTLRILQFFHIIFFHFGTTSFEKLFFGESKSEIFLARLNLCNIWNRELLPPMFLHLLDITYFELIKKSGLNFEAFWWKIHFSAYFV